MKAYMYDEHMDKVSLTRVDELVGEHADDVIAGGTLVPEYTKFIGEVQKAFRGCKLRSREAQETNANKLHLYMPEDTFSMGAIWITYNDDNELLYCVKSHKVRNGKYNSYSNDFRICITKRPDTALKNAKKYLQRLTHSDIVRATSHECYDTVHAYKRKEQDSLDTLYRQVFDIGYRDNLPPIVKEMFHLVDVGHSFLDAEWNIKLIAVKAKHKSYLSTVEDSSEDLYCVRVHERIGTQMFEVTKTDSSVISHYRPKEGVDFVGVLTADDLPEGVLGKLGVMAICENGAYVPQVGYRYDESIFYVTQ